MPASSPRSRWLALGRKTFWQSLWQNLRQKFPLRFFHRYLRARFQSAPLALGALLISFALALSSSLPWLPELCLLGLFCASLRIWKKGLKPSWALSCLLAGFCLLGIILKQGWQQNQQAVLQERHASSEAPLGYEVEIQRALGRSAAAESKQVLATLLNKDLPAVQLAISSAEPLPAGARLRLRGKLEPLSAARNPGGFDRRQWLAAQGVSWQLNFPQIIELEEHPRSAQALLAKLRQWSVERLQHGLQEDQGRDILPALVLGLSGEIDYPLKEQFRAAGALHLFAVSGLHVGLVAGLFALILRPLPHRYRWSLLLILLGCFVLLAGLRPSAVRAWVMVALVLMGLLRARTHVALNSLGLAALIELLWRPQHLHDPGFQFSYLVVTSLLLIALPIQTRLLRHPWFHLDPLLPENQEPLLAKLKRLSKSYLLALVLISAISWLAALPIALSQFGLFNPLALLLNVLLVPLATLALCFGLLGMLGSMLWLPLGWPLRFLAQKLTTCMAMLAQEGAHQMPPLLIDRDPLPAAAHSRLTLLELDFGYAIFLEHGTRRILYDCAHARDWEFTLKPFLRYRGVGSLDALILSHADAAHIGAAPALLKEFPVRQIFLPPGNRSSPSWSAALEAAQAQQIPLQRIARGHTASLSPHAHLEVLHPPADFRAPRADEDLMLLNLQLGQHQWLLTSDLGWRVEAQLAQAIASKQGFDGIILESGPNTTTGYPAFWQNLSPAASSTSQPRQPFVQLRRRLPEPEAQAPESHIFSTQEHGALIAEFDQAGKLIRLRGWASGLEQE